MNTDPNVNLESDDAAEHVYEGEVVLETDIELERLSPSDLGLDVPDDADAAQQMLLREIRRARNDADEYLDTLQRLAADFENFRKRAARDQRSVVDHAAQRVIEQLLPALDSFDAAMAVEAQSPTEEKLLEGMRGTHTQLLDILGKEGLSIIPTMGEPFDPAVHEAVAGPSGDGDGDLVVAQEMRRGYKLGSRVVRPALVMVDHA